MKTIRANFDWFILGLITLPGLLLLAHWPQGPDGAEMLMTALHGGVMHPSGAPLQAWIDFPFAQLDSLNPAWGLSLLSWIFFFLSGVVFLLTTRNLKLATGSRTIGILAFLLPAAFYGLALQPEKYTLLVWTIILGLSIQLSLKYPLTFKHYALLVSSTVLALAQHPAGIILVPGTLYCVFCNKRKSLNQKLVHSLIVLFSIGFLVALAHLSLLGLRGAQPWVDWGHLNTVQDVWFHFLRRDFNWIQLYNSNDGGTTVSGFSLFIETLEHNLIFLFLILFGVFKLAQRQRQHLVIVCLSLAGALFILFQTELPGSVIEWAEAYADRYWVVTLPMLALLAAYGSEWFKKNSRFATAIKFALGLGLIFFNRETLLHARTTDNKTFEIFRAQAAEELPQGALYLTTNDFELFYGLKPSNQLVFPLKNLLGHEWYRTEVAPQLHPEIKSLLRDWPKRPHDFPDLVRLAIERHLSVAMTSAALVVSYPDIMAHAEQTGVMWIFNENNHQLYTDKIVKNAVPLCRRISEITVVLPQHDRNFMQMPLENFSFAFLGLGDALAQNSQAQALAHQIAHDLVPGVEPEVWREHCRQLLGVLRVGSLPN